MKKILIITLIFSLFTTNLLADICQFQFLRNYDTRIQELEKLTNNTFANLKNKILKTKDLSKKFDLLEEQYELISKVFHSRKEMTKVIVQAQELSEKEIQALYKKVFNDLINENKAHINFITNQAQEMLEGAGANIQVRYRKIAEDIQYKYIELLDNANNNSNAARLISRYKEVMDTKTVTFDFFENIDFHSAGFSQSANRRIDLGISGVRNIVLDDLVTMVGKHEFKHAGFARMRSLNKDSIYHSQFMSNSDRSLTSSKIYEHYMSSEELYNFANNPLWASERMRSISKFAPQDYIDDLLQINRYIKMTNSISMQTTELTSDFIKLIKNTDLKDPSKLSISFFNKSYQPSQGLDEVFYIAINDHSKQRILMEFVNPEMMNEVRVIFQQKQKIMTKFTNEIVKIDPQDAKAIAELQTQFYLAEMQAAEKQYQNVLNHVIKKQEVLNRVATRIKSENAQLLAKNETFIRDLKSSVEQGINPSLSTEWQQAFKEMTIEYRRMGNMVREDYKGFVGNIEALKVKN